MKNIYLPTRLERFHAYVSVLLRGEQSRYDAFFSGAQFPAGNLVRLTDEDTSRKPVTDVRDPKQNQSKLTIQVAPSSNHHNEIHRRRCCYIAQLCCCLHCLVVSTFSYVNWWSFQFIDWASNAGDTESERFLLIQHHHRSFSRFSGTSLKTSVRNDSSLNMSTGMGVNGK